MSERISRNPDSASRTRSPHKCSVLLEASSRFNSMHSLIAQNARAKNFSQRESKEKTFPLIDFQHFCNIYVGTTCIQNEKLAVESCSSLEKFACSSDVECEELETMMHLLAMSKLYHNVQIKNFGIQELFNYFNSMFTQFRDVLMALREQKV